MGILFKMIDAIEEKLGHSPHPAIVSLPLGAWTVSAICDVLGLTTRQRAYDDTARLSMGIGLVGAVGALATGLHDYSYIPRDRPTHALATTHAAGMVVATSLLATSFLLRERAPHQAGGGTSLTARVLALSGWGVSMYAAYLGGVLVEEHGEAVKPIIRQQKEEQKRKKAREQVSSASPRERTHTTGSIQ